MKTVIGWCDAWTSPYKQVKFTDEHKRALIERIKKRGYNFTYESHQTLPYAAPFYSDGEICVLTKSQWDSVFDEAYKDMPRGIRLMPMDVIDDEVVNEILFEKPKFKEQYMEKTNGDVNNG